MDIATLENDDLILWQEFCQGNELSFEILIHRYYSRLYRYGTRIWPDDAIVRDCLQELFTDVWVRKEQLLNVTSVNYYLISAVRKRLLFEKRKQKPFHYLDSWDESEMFICEFNVESDLISQEEKKQKATRLNILINTLSSRQKEVIYLRFFNELDHDQIAELMGLTRQSVYNLLYETIRRLRNMWLVLLFLSF